MKRKTNGLWWVTGAVAVALVVARSVGHDLVRYIRITRM